MPIPPAILTLVGGILLVLLGLAIGQNLPVLPLMASTNAAAYDSLFRVLFSIGTGLFIGIVAVVVIALVRFRRQPGDQLDGPPVEGNLQLEVFWTAVPAIVVLLIGVYSYDIYDQMGGMADVNHHGMAHHSIEADVASQVPDSHFINLPDPEAAQRHLWGGIDQAAREGQAALPIDVTAMQFAFIFHYPDGDFTTADLHIPAGRPVELHLKAQDVIHAFWVPQFRLKQDVIPGQPTLLSFTANRTGTYPIVCAELCGTYHGAMRSTVTVDSADSFEAWVASHRPSTIAQADPRPTG